VGADPAAVAKDWAEGLSGWGIGPERIAALRDGAEFTIYTPGSTAGVPLNLVGGLSRPSEGADAQAVADEIEGFVSGLLTMVGIDPDPLAGREHILLSNLIDHAGAAGQDLDLPTLVTRVQDPPLRKLGVYDLEAFYPDGAEPPTRTSEAADDTAGDTVTALPPVADGIPVRWLDPAAPWAARIGAVPGGTRLVPAWWPGWRALRRRLRTEPPAGAAYVLTDAPLERAAYFGGAEKAIIDHLYRSRTRQVLRNRELKLAARAGETADEFAARCLVGADQGADDAQAVLQDRYEARIARARDAVGAARDRVAEAEAAQSTRRTGELAAGAGSLLGAMPGGRRSARTIARDVGRAITGRSRSDQAARRVQTGPLDHRHPRVSGQPRARLSSARPEMLSLR
jgi:hypothetical protein